MTVGLQELIALDSDHLWLEFSASEKEEAWQLAQKDCSNSSARYNAYLNRLCLKAILAWLQEEPDIQETPLVSPRSDRLPNIWEFVNGTAITLGNTRLVLIPNETDDLDEFCVPQEWVELPGWAGDYYLAVQVEPEDCWLRVWGYTTHQKLKEVGEYDRLTQMYSLEREDLIEDINVMLVARKSCPAEKATIAPLPTLTSADAENLIERLGQPTSYSPRLDIPCEQWKALIANDNWRQRLYEKRCGKTQSLETTLVRLGQWLKKKEGIEAVKAGWQALDEIWGTRPTNLALSWRTAFPSSALGIRRAKIYNLEGHEPVVLLIALRPETDRKVSLLIQLRPSGRIIYLPDNLKLILFSESGDKKKEIESNGRDKFIQLPEFKVPDSTRFSIQIALGDFSLTENFIADCF